MMIVGNGFQGFHIFMKAAGILLFIASYAEVVLRSFVESGILHFF